MLYKKRKPKAMQN